MKLRIRGNSIRLRLLKPEVAVLAREGEVEESICFGPGREQTFTYAIQSAVEVVDIAARFEKNRITIAVPAAALKRWSTSNEISMSAVQRLDDESSLDILVEKDLECLDRIDPDHADAFDRPASSPEC